MNESTGIDEYKNHKWYRFVYLFDINEYPLSIKMFFQLELEVTNAYGTTAGLLHPLSLPGRLHVTMR